MIPSTLDPTIVAAGIVAALALLSAVLGPSIVAIVPLAWVARGALPSWARPSWGAPRVDRSTRRAARWYPTKRSDLTRSHAVR